MALMTGLQLKSVIWGGDWVLSDVTIQQGEWSHIAMTWDVARNERKIFLGGELVGERPDSVVPKVQNNLGIGLWIGWPDSWGDDSFTGLIDDVRVYDYVLTLEEVVDAMHGTGPELASEPDPEDVTTDVAVDTVVTWIPGEFAATHDVYIGTSFDDVNDASKANPMGVLLSQGQAVTAYDPADLLEFNTTYYWRIDEVNAAPDNTIFKGPVWSFTTEPLAYPIERISVSTNATFSADTGPEKTIDGSGLNVDDQHSMVSTDMFQGEATDGEPIWLLYEFDRLYKLHEMLVWNYNQQFEMLLGFGVQNMTVEYSADGDEWGSLGDVEVAQGTAKTTYTANTTVDFGGAAVQYVRLTLNDNWGSMPSIGLSELRFLYIPAHAREPEPVDGAAGVDVNTILAWRAGRDATAHEVYFGTDSEALELAGTPRFRHLRPGDAGSRRHLLLEGR